MPRVRGSKQLEMRVVPHRPLFELAIRLGVACSLLVIAVGAFYLGFRRGVDINGDARQERASLFETVTNQQQEIDLLKEQLLFSQQSNIVDRQALQSVRSTLVSQQETIRQLEEDLLYYRSVMSPESDVQGVTVGKMELDEVTNGENLWRYTIELRQQGNNGDEQKGSARISVTGHSEGKEKVLTLSDLTSSKTSDEVTYAFRYFQNLEGEIELPGNFIPEKLHVSLIPENRKETGMEKSIDW